MFSWIKKLLFNKYLGIFIRHGLTALSGVLIAIGLEQEQVKEFVDVSYPVLLGVATYLVGILLSWIEKRKKRI